MSLLLRRGVFSGALAVGKIGRLYHCDVNTDKLYEIDPDTLLDLSSGGVTSPGTNPQGIGGISERLYHCDANLDKLYEIDPDTLLDISAGGVNSPGSNPTGIGGISTRLYHCDANLDKLYEIDPDTLLDIKPCRTLLWLVIALRRFLTNHE